jgi:hypothetical protein
MRLWERPSLTLAALTTMESRNVFLRALDVERMSPSPPVLGGRGVGVRGETSGKIVPLTPTTLPRGERGANPPNSGEA